ncbi:MAG: GGDEF domain-containing protein [Lachnospiraceae bacterium]|nr:GGDEF domain-containing protein [Lachnospiraceae bacterium]
MEYSLMEATICCMLRNSRDLIFIKDVNLVYRAVSDSFVKMVGKTSVEEIIGYTDREIFADSQLAKRYELDDRKLLESGKDLPRFIEPITDEGGQPRYGATSKHILRDETGKVIGLLGVTEDVTEEYRARQRHEQLFRYLFDLPEDTYAVSYIDVDDWRIIKQRRREIEDGTLQACHTIEELCDYAVNSITNGNAEAEEFYRTFTPENLRGIYVSGRRRLSFEYERKLSDGSVRWVENKVHFLIDADNNHLCVMLSAKDINKSKVEEQKILEAAKLDRMTGVMNRETAMEEIRAILREEGDAGHSLYMLDVDNFKALNDTLGHQTGDEFLIRLAAKLKETVRENDIIGRIGGDEFFIFLRNVADPCSVETKAQQLLSVISGVAADYLQVNMSGSIGIGRYPEHGRELDTLYANADAALYEAKHAGKNCYRMAK